MGRLGAVLGASWAVLGRQKPEKARMLRFFQHLKEMSGFCLLRPLLGGSLGAFLGRLGGLSGRLGAVLGASWAVLERRKAEKATWPKTVKNNSKINVFCLLGPSWEASSKPLEASWRPLEGLLGRLGALLDRLEAILGHLRTL